MADSRILAAVKSIGRATSDNVWKSQRGTRDGSAFTAEYLQALAMEGRVFAANMGTVATQLTFLTQAANRPDAWIRVPAGTTIIPVFAHVALGAFTGTVTTLDMRIAQNDIGNGTSTAASVGPVSMRTDAPVASNCTARHLATADTTAETNPISIWKHVTTRADEAGAGIANDFHIDRLQMGMPVLIGPATWELFIWATTNQATGYVVMSWAELPSTDFV